jgi:hypothetical protein
MFTFHSSGCHFSLRRILDRGLNSWKRILLTPLRSGTWCWLDVVQYAVFGNEVHSASERAQFTGLLYEFHWALRDVWWSLFRSHVWNIESWLGAVRLCLDTFFLLLIYYTDSVYKVYRDKLQNCSCNQFQYIGTYRQVETNSMTKNRGGNDGSEKWMEKTLRLLVG